MDGVAALRRIIEEAEHVSIFTGAGISTESGIPDFRSPTGIWATSKPILFQDFVASPTARREAWRRKFESDPVLLAARPNRGHRNVSEWRAGNCSASSSTSSNSRSRCAASGVVRTTVASTS